MTGERLPGSGATDWSELRAEFAFSAEEEAEIQAGKERLLAVARACRASEAGLAVPGRE
ncbi:hypothetical protein ACFP1Z_20550 [Streptomyces gamaensis]|uniref:Uncharacterized protein n=1 Tax=Streptomyces gamaensis TaxID=1763542 RepID=A0ABW0Z3R5_9ACTN